MQQVYAVVDIGTQFKDITQFQDIGSLVTVVVKNAFVVAGLIMFALLVFGGFGMIVAGSSGDAKKLEEGQKAITGAVIGLLVIVGSFWIMQIVEKLTGLTLLPK